MSLLAAIGEAFGTPMKRLGTVAFSLYEDLSNNTQFFNAVHSAVRQEMEIGSSGGKTLNWILAMNPDTIGMTAQEVTKDPVMAMTKGLIFKMAEMGADSYMTYKKQGLDNETAIALTNANIFETRTELLGGRSIAEAVTTPGLVGRAASIMSYTDKSGEVSTLYPFISIGDGSVVGKTFRGILDVNSKTGDPLDVGSPLGAFLQSASERTLIGSAVTKVYDYLSGNSPSLLTDYRAAAMQENMYGSKEMSMLGSPGRLGATLVGFAGSIAENMLASKTGGTLASLGLNVTKSRLSDYDMATGMEEHFNAKKWSHGLIYDTVTTSFGLALSQAVGTVASGVLGDVDGTATIAKMMKSFTPSTVGAVGFIPLKMIGINTAVDMFTDYGFHRMTMNMLDYSQGQMRRYDLSGDAKDKATKIANEFMFRSAMVIGSGLARNMFIKQHSSPDAMFSMPWFEKEFGSEPGYKNVSRFQMRLTSLMWDVYPGNVKAVAQLWSTGEHGATFTERLKQGQVSFHDYMDYWALAEMQSNTMFKWIVAPTGAVNATRLSGVMFSQYLRGLAEAMEEVSAGAVELGSVEKALAFGEIGAETYRDAITELGKAGQVSEENALQVLGTIYNIMKWAKIPEDKMSVEDILRVQAGTLEPFVRVLNDLSVYGNKLISKDTLITLMKSLQLDTGKGLVDRNVAVEQYSYDVNDDKFKALETTIFNKIKNATLASGEPLFQVSEDTLKQFTRHRGEYFKLAEQFEQRWLREGSGKEVDGRVVADLDDEDKWKYRPMYKTHELLLKSEVGGENLHSIVRRLSDDVLAALKTGDIRSWVEYFGTVGNISAKIMGSELEGLAKVLERPELTNEDKVLAAMRAKEAIDTMQMLFFKYADKDKHISTLKELVQNRIEPQLREIRRKMGDTTIGGVKADKLFLNFEIYEGMNFRKSAISPFIMLDEHIGRNLGLGHELGPDGNVVKVFQITNSYNWLAATAEELGGWITVRNHLGDVQKLDFNPNTIANGLRIYDEYMRQSTTDRTRVTEDDMMSVLAAFTMKYINGKYIESQLPNKTGWDSVEKSLIQELKADFGIDVVSFNGDTNKLEIKFNRFDMETVHDAMNKFSRPVLDAKEILTPGLVTYKEGRDLKKVFRYTINGRTKHENIDGIYRDLVRAYPEIEDHVAMIVANNLDEGSLSIKDGAYEQFMSMLQRKIFGFSLEIPGNEPVLISGEDKRAFAESIMRRAVEAQGFTSSIELTKMQNELYAELGTNKEAINKTTNLGGHDVESYTVDIALLTEAEQAKVKDILKNYGYTPVEQKGNTQRHIVYVKAAQSALVEQTRYTQFIKDMGDQFRFEQIHLDTLDKDLVKYDWRWWLRQLHETDFNERVDNATVNGEALDDGVKTLLKQAKQHYDAGMTSEVSTDKVRLKLRDANTAVRKAMAELAKVTVDSAAFLKPGTFGTIEDLTSAVVPIASAGAFKITAEWEKWYKKEMSKKTPTPLGKDTNLYKDMMEFIKDISDPTEKEALMEDIIAPWKSMQFRPGGQHLTVSAMPLRITKLLETRVNAAYDPISEAIKIFNASAGNLEIAVQAKDILVEEAKSWLDGDKRTLFGKEHSEKVLKTIMDISTRMGAELQKITDLPHRQAQKYPGTFVVAETSNDDTRVLSDLYAAYLSKGYSIGLATDNLPKRWNALVPQRMYTNEEVDAIANHVFDVLKLRPTFAVVDEIKTVTGQKHDGEVLMKSWLYKIYERTFAAEGLTMQAFNSLMKVSLRVDDSIDSDVVIHTGAMKKVDPVLGVMISQKMFDGVLTSAGSKKKSKALFKLFTMGMSKQSDVYERSGTTVPSSQLANYGAYGQIVINRKYNINRMRDRMDKYAPTSYNEYLNAILAGARNAGEVKSVTGRLASGETDDPNQKSFNLVSRELWNKFSGKNTFGITYHGESKTTRSAIDLASGVSIIFLAKQASLALGTNRVLNDNEQKIMDIVNNVFARANQYNGDPKFVPDYDLVGQQGRDLLKFLSARDDSHFTMYTVNDAAGKNEDVFTALNVRFSIDNDAHMVESVVTTVLDVDAPEVMMINQKYAYMQNGDFDKDTFITMPTSKAALAEALVEEYGLSKRHFHIANTDHINDEMLFSHLLSHQGVVLDRNKSKLLSNFSGEEEAGTAESGSQLFYGSSIKFNTSLWQSYALLRAIDKKIYGNTNALLSQDLTVRPGDDSAASKLANIHPSFVGKRRVDMQPYELVIDKNNYVLIDTQGSTQINDWKVRGGLRTLKTGRIDNDHGWFTFDISGVKYFAITKAEQNQFALKNLGVFYYGEDFNDKIMSISNGIKNNTLDSVLEDMGKRSVVRNFGNTIRFAQSGDISMTVSKGFVDMVSTRNGVPMMKARIKGDDRQKIEALQDLMVYVEAGAATILEATIDDSFDVDQGFDRLVSDILRRKSYQSQVLRAIPVVMSNNLRKESLKPTSLGIEGLNKVIALSTALQRAYGINNAFIIETRFDSDAEGGNAMVKQVADLLREYIDVVKTADEHLDGKTITKLGKSHGAEDEADVAQKFTNRLDKLKETLSLIRANGKLNYLSNNMYVLSEIYSDPNTVDDIKEGFKLPHNVRKHLTGDSYARIFNDKLSLLPTSPEEVKDIQNAFYAVRTAEYLLHNTGTLLTAGSLFDRANTLGKAKMYIAENIDNTEDLVTLLYNQLRSTSLTSGNLLSKQSVREMLRTIGIGITKTEGLGIMYSSELLELNRTGLDAGFLLNKRALKKEFNKVATMGKHGVLELNGKHVTSETLYNAMVKEMSTGKMSNKDRARMKAVFTGLTALVDRASQENMFLLGEGITSQTLKELGAAIQGNDGIDYKLDLSKLSKRFSFEVNDNSKLLSRAVLEELGGPVSDMGYKTRTRGVCL